jgi:hypothetical protein
MACSAVARPRAPINPFTPISRIANAAVAKAVVERLLNHEAPSGPEWRAFAEAEVRLALDAAARVPSPAVGAV